MTHVFPPNRGDSLVEWAGALLFAALLGSACLILGDAKLASIGAIAGMVAGYAILRRVPASAIGASHFVPEAFETVLDEADELLLDDPLIALDSSSRVVKLFATGESSPAALVARIEDYLGSDRDRGVRVAAAGEAPKHQADASAALHAALSNIRASLR